jgi:biopolymer transport protein TolQ
LGTGFLTSVAQSGFLGQAIVGFLLLISIYSWAIILHKHRGIRRAKTRSEQFLGRFREDPTGIVNRFDEPQQFPPSPFARILEAGLSELSLIMRVRSRTQAATRAMSSVQIDGLDRTLERAIAIEVIELRRHLLALATTAGAAPFVGLFGTVWGIMKAFAAMSVTGSASISSVAPGVSAALTTTVAGLAVAIPALVGYNYLMNRVRNLTIHMESFSSEFLSTVERNFGSR